jgi:hypothetical protein
VTIPEIEDLTGFTLGIINAGRRGGETQDTGVHGAQPAVAQETAKYWQSARSHRSEGGVSWTMNTILAPVDFSSVTDSVVAEGSRLAKAFRMRLFLFQVLAPPNIPLCRTA